MLYLVASESLFSEPGQAPGVVATITTDKAVLRGMSPHHVLSTIAHRLGVTEFDIVTGDQINVPGQQLPLPLPTVKRR